MSAVISMTYALITPDMVKVRESTDRLGHTEMTADMRASDPDQARLSAFWDGGSLQRPLPRTGTLTIGRSSGCDVRIDHASVSRKHAVLHLGPTIRVEDAGSANGTRVGGKTATSGAPLAVVPGEVIEVGQVVLVIQGGDANIGRGSAPRTPAAATNRPMNKQAFSATIAPPPATRANETPMQRVERLVRLVAAGNIHVLVLGETGTGKEVIAERVHKASRRAQGPFIRL